MDMTERRRLQNRIAQRKFRQKKSGQRAPSTEAMQIHAVRHPPQPTAMPVLRAPPPYHAIHYPQYYAVPEPPPYIVEPVTTHSSDEGLFDFQWNEIYSKTDLRPDDIDYLASLRPLPSYIPVPQPPSTSNGHATSGKTDVFSPGSASGVSNSSARVRTSTTPTPAAIITQAGNEHMITNTSPSARPSAHPPDPSRLSPMEPNGHVKSVSGSYKALHIAAGNGHDRTVRVLLDRDIDCEERDSSGRSALTLAVINGHEAVVRTLLGHGARVDAIDHERRSALHWAVLYRRETVLNLLLDHSSQGRDLNIDAYEISGWTPLHIAVEKGFEAGMLRLLQCGADLHFRARRNPINGAIIHPD